MEVSTKMKYLQNRLNDLLLNEVLTEGKLSWDVEDERVL